MDVSCNLGSLDIYKATKVHNFEVLIDTAVRLLTNVSNMTHIKNVPPVANGNELMHSIGLGVMNLHGHLVTEGIRYGSKESIAFIDAFMEAVNFFSIKSSMEIAKKTGIKFYRFADSDYANGEYFKRYTNKEDVKVSRVVHKALGNVPIITKEMWSELQQDVEQYGLFHSYRLAIAPTGK